MQSQVRTRTKENEPSGTVPSREAYPPPHNVFYSGCTQNVKICLSALILLACPHPQSRLIIATKKKCKSVSTFGKELLAMQMSGRL